MSKLDYLTIGIVAVCIAAIIFLIVKITGLMNNDQRGIEPNRIEDALGKEAKPDADTYQDLQSDSARAGMPAPSDTEDPDDEEVDYYDPVGEEDRFQKEREPAAKPGEVDPDYAAASEEELTSRGVEAPATTPRETRPGGTEGKYMVLAGSFRYKSNAEQMVRKLRKLGYEEAEIGYTNRGAYAVALVRRYDDLSAARSLVEELKNKHSIEAIVKTEE